jgi:hypothetical protein
MANPARSRVADTLGSLRLGVALLAALGAACVVATFYESRHGTAAAQRDFYQTDWFAALLVLLGVNILFAVVRKYPWRRHQAGFLTAHVGILVLLAGSLVSLRLGVDGRLALYEGEEGDRISLPAQAVHVALPGHQVHASFPLDVARLPRPADTAEHRLEVGGGAASLVIEEALAHAQVSETLEEGDGGAPALHFTLQGSFGGHDAWLVAGDPERAHLDFGPVAFDLHVAGEGEHDGHGGAGVNRLAFVANADGTLTYTLTSRKDQGSRGTAVPGKAIDTPWMGMQVLVDRYLPSAVARRTAVPGPAATAEDSRVPAVRLRLEGPQGRSRSEWLAWNDARALRFGDGYATVSFRAPEAPLPFRVRLIDFKSEKYPGSERAATYESRVRVEDPERGVTEHVVSMNHPLRYRGYVFFQSSFVEGEPMISVFSVARAPGLPLVYLGTTLISVGVFWMFYLKPWLLRRQAAQALAARAA